MSTRPRLPGRSSSGSSEAPAPDVDRLPLFRSGVTGLPGTCKSRSKGIAATLCLYYCSLGLSRLMLPSWQDSDYPEELDGVRVLANNTIEVLSRSSPTACQVKWNLAGSSDPYLSRSRGLDTRLNLVFRVMHIYSREELYGALVQSSIYPLFNRMLTLICCLLCELAQYIHLSFLHSHLIST